MPRLFETIFRILNSVPFWGVGTSPTFMAVPMAIMQEYSGLAQRHDLRGLPGRSAGLRCAIASREPGAGSMQCPRDRICRRAHVIAERSVEPLPSRPTSYA